MDNITEIKKAIIQLPNQKQKELREWFETFEQTKSDPLGSSNSSEEVWDQFADDVLSEYQSRKTKPTKKRFTIRLYRSVLSILILISFYGFFSGFLKESVFASEELDLLSELNKLKNEKNVKIFGGVQKTIMSHLDSAAPSFKSIYLLFLLYIPICLIAFIIDFAIVLYSRKKSMIDNVRME